MTKEEIDSLYEATLSTHRAALKDKNHYTADSAAAWDVIVNAIWKSDAMASRFLFPVSRVDYIVHLIEQDARDKQSGVSIPFGD